MSKYVVDDNDRIEIKFYIDTRGKKLEVFDEKQVKILLDEEIDGKKNKLATLVAMEESEENTKKKELLEIEIKELSEKKSPSYLVEETAYFVKPDGAAQEYIDKKGYKRVPNQPKMEYDSIEYNKAFMAVLLRGWTFEETEPKLKLEFGTMPGFESKQKLTDGTVERICRMDADLYKSVTQISYLKIYGKDDELKN